MDLGEVTFKISVLGESEARRAMEDHIRDQDRLVQSMDESARAAMRAAEVRERAIQRELKAYDDLVRQAQQIERAYQSLAASFDPVNKAQLQYMRGVELLDKALEEKIITDKQYQRTLKDLESQMQATIAAEKLRAAQVIKNEEKQNAAALEQTARAYDRLLSSLDPATAATMRYQDAIQVAKKALDEGIITENEYNRVLDKAEIRRATELMKAAAQADREASAAKNKLTSENQRLEAELSVFAATVSQTERAQLMYSRATDLTTRAVAAGIITQDRANEIMAETQFRIQSMGHYVNDMGQVMSRSDSAWTRWSRGGIQQAGYQVNDFFVQMQMGTPFMVAFTQQFSQLAGSMGQWGAVLGGVVAIVGAAISIYMNWGDATEDLSKAHDELFKKLDSVGDLMERLRDTDLEQEFGNTTDVVRELTQALLELEKAGALKELQSTLKTLRETFEPGFVDGIMASFAVAANARTIGAPGRNTPVVTMESVRDEQIRDNFDNLGLGIGYEAFERIVDEMDKAAKSGDMELVVELVNKMLKQSFQDIEGYQKALEGGGASLVTTYAEVAIETARIAANLNGSAVAEQEKADRVKKNLEELSAIEDMLHEQRLERYRIETAKEDERRQKLIELRGIMGEFLAERAEAEREAAKKSDEFISNYIRMVTDPAITEAENSREGAAKTVRDLQREMESILVSISNMDISAPFVNVLGSIQNAINKAKELANYGGMTSGPPGDAKVPSGLGSEVGLLYGNVPPALGGGVDMPTSVVPKSSPRGIGGVDWGTSNGGGGGGGSKEREDALQKLREQIKLEDELLGKTEAYARVVRALGDDRNKYSEQEIANVIKEIEALEMKKAVMDQVGEITRTMQSSFEEGFMSIMSGTSSVEDAFKKMAFNIIQELYRVLVVQQIVGQWNATTGTGSGIVGWIGKLLGGFANGAAFSDGRVTAFAKGGVVDSPTLFPMSGGLGLMGEAGPEAVMPLSRGPDGRLGVQVSGGAASEPPVQVNNHINVPPGANAEAVRAEVVRMLPTITDATTAAVVRARQRGGSMRDAFRN